MDILSQFKTNKVLLLLMPGIDYIDVSTNVIRSLSKYKVGYVTLNKTCESLQETFKNKKIKQDNIIFIDAISKTIKQPKKIDRCHFVSSPGQLRAIGSAMVKLMNHNFDYIIFDSLTNLSVYKRKDAIAKFITVMANKAKASNTKLLFYGVGERADDVILKHTCTVVDDIIDLTSKSPLAYE
jgi:hypothetical protein